MKVNELIAMLQKLPQDATVKINDSIDFMVWNSPTVKAVEIVAEEGEEIIAEEYDDYFKSITPPDDGEILDMMYINKAFN